MKIVDHALLAKTRAEEHDADVWGQFYIPPYFQKLELKSATRSVYIIGKRGCGKTMLLKYMDYHTAFSPKRVEIPNDELAHVGVYWRVDTQFCNSLKMRGIEEEQWKTIFDGYFAIVVSIEIIKAMRAIAKSAYAHFNEENFKVLHFGSASDFHPEFPTGAEELERYLEKSRRTFTTWVSNVSSMSQPLLPPGRSFVSALIEDLRSMPALAELGIYVYVDEVENLVPYQRRVLNTYLKHSERPFIVSFTSKELSGESATTGPEAVNATHDFRLVALDDMLQDPERSVFFAEVYLANLDLAQGRADSPAIQRLLTPEGLADRHTQAYRDATLGAIRRLFPSKSTKDVAREAVNEPRIRKILEDRLTRALDKRKSPDKLHEFMAYGDVPDALVTLPALVNRSNLKLDDILAALAEYRAHGTGPFARTWIHNNLFGALLELYRPYQAICPLYSGFDTFCIMSGNNLRHFLILAYKALEVTELLDEDVQIFSVPIQAAAAFEASGKFIDEIRTFGEYGERLRIFVLRLGGVFRGLQALPAMSEPEQNQFTINSGARPLSSNEERVLYEARKYAILLEQLETKTKGKVGTDVVDYQLNPIFAPYFQISYRRKRKIELSVEDFNVLALGTESEYRALCSRVFKGEPASNEALQLGLWE